MVRLACEADGVLDEMLPWHRELRDRLGKLAVKTYPQPAWLRGHAFLPWLLWATKVVSSVCTITQSRDQRLQVAVEILFGAGIEGTALGRIVLKSASAQLPSRSAFRWRESAGHAQGRPGQNLHLP